MTTRWTLGRKMVALLLVASTLPLLLTTYLHHRESRARMDDATSRYVTAVADAAAHNLDALNHRYQRTVRAIVALPEIRNQCPVRGDGFDEAHTALTTLKRADPEQFGLSVVDPQGRITLSSDDVFVGVAVADRHYYQRALATDGIVSTVLISRSAAVEAAVVFALRFGPPDAPCVAIVATNARDLFDTVRNLNQTMGRTGYVQVLDEHGVRIAHGFRDDLLFHPAGILPEVEAEQMRRERRFGTETAALLADVVPVPTMWQEARRPRVRRDVWRAYTPGTGDTNVIAARRLETAPWTMFALVPTRVVDDPIAAFLRTMALLGVVLTGLALVTGLVVARRVLAPVHELIRATRALGSGDRTARARVAATDEIGELARSFNAAADAAADAAEALETKVGERTAALTAANHELLASRAELVAQKDELRAQRDELAQQSKDVERADRMKSEFLANMSHELRTPLNSVIGFADLLQVTADDRLREVERGYLTDIVAAGRHLLLIINDILDLAKIEAGHVRLAIEALDPEELCTTALTMAQGMARPRGIELRLTVGAARRGRGDPDRLRQVLLNLLSNAIKFSPDGATVDLRVDDDGDHLAFAVTDRGPGIPADAQERLFQPFVQGESALVKRHQGTGLGLAISKKLIDLHDGVLGVTSQPGVGSTFRFTIPAAGRRRQPEPAAPRDATVLLVAAPHVVDGHRRRLEPAGYHVVDGEAGADLLAAAARVDAAVIVIDVGSLGDGPVADHILADAPRLSQRIPVVLLSAEPEVLAAKPIDATALQALCRRLVARDDGAVRVLVVDDDPRVAGLVAGALGPRYRVEAAATAAEGLARARAGGHDLHVIDLLLPDGSGFDVLAALNDEPALRKIPRVVLTAAELDAADRDRLRRYAHAVAHKGMVTPDELVHVVDRLALGQLTGAGAGEPGVLVVDDNDMNRTLARSILERLAYRVIEARDGVEAIAVAEREHPALILMDLAMPGKDGFQTTRELRAHATLSDTPIVAVSAMAMRSDEERARAAGVDAFLSKPLDRDALERTVARYVRDGGRR